LRSACPPPAGCRFYFAHRVSFLTCADIDIDYYERALPPLSSTWSKTEPKVERPLHHVHF
jgi:hypothetical protein